MNPKATIAFGLCGSFCTFQKVVPLIEALQNQGYRILPVMSFHAAQTDTRFGTGAEWQAKLAALTGTAPLLTLPQVEPLGPKGLADAFVVAPCTGNTLAKLDLGISDTPITLGVKSMLRNGKPILLAPSTNDGLGASARHLSELMNRKHFYLVPLGQDDPYAKPCSLQSCFDLLPDALELALQGKQLQPVLLT